MKKILTLLAAIAVFTSCTLEQTYTFNEDFSGTYIMNFDISQMAAFSTEDGQEAGDLFEDFNQDSLRDLYRNMKGISNVEIKTTENVINLKYDFDNLENLNQSLLAEQKAQEAFGDMADKPRFEYKKGTFIYNAPNLGSDADQDSLSQMLAVVEYDITLNFAKKITSVSNGVLSEDGKTVKMTGNMGEVALKEKSLQLEVKFK